MDLYLLSNLSFSSEHIENLLKRSLGCGVLLDAELGFPLFKQAKQEPNGVTVSAQFELKLVAVRLYQSHFLELGLQLLQYVCALLLDVHPLSQLRNTHLTSSFYMAPKVRAKSSQRQLRLQGQCIKTL